MPTPLEVLRAHFASIDAAGAPAIELSLRGVSDEDALLALTSIDDRWSVERGGSELAAFSVSAHWADVVDLIEGYGSVEAAMIDGRLTIAGDLLLAMRWVPRLFTSSGSR